MSNSGQNMIIIDHAQFASARTKNIHSRESEYKSEVCFDDPSTQILPFPSFPFPLVDVQQHSTMTTIN